MVFWHLSTNTITCGQEIFTPLYFVYKLLRRLSKSKLWIKIISTEAKKMSFCSE